MIEYLFGGLTTLGIIAQILSLIGNILFTSSSLFKNRHLILILQCINHVLSMIAEIIQKLFAGVVQEVASLTRNIILMFVKDDKKVLKIVVISIITFLAVGVGVFVNIYVSSNKWQGYLPIAATLIYTTFLLVAFVKNPGPIQSEALIKMGLFLSSLCWAVYGVSDEGKLYAITVFNILTIISCIFSYVRIVKIHYRIRKHVLTYQEANAMELKREEEMRENFKKRREAFRNRRLKKEEDNIDNNSNN